MQHVGSKGLTPARVRPYVAAVSVRDTDLLRVELDGAGVVPLAEELGLVRELDLRVPARGCRQVADWQGVAATGNRSGPE